MRAYWLKIAVGMLLVFGVGYGLHAAIGKARSSAKSDADVTIPLGGFAPFRIGGAELGRLRAITLHRSPERRITGIRISVRTSDSAAFERLRDCRLTVEDPREIDPSTSFLCLESDSGYVDFGELHVSLRREGHTTLTQVSPFLLPEAAARDIREGRGEGAIGVDREAIRAQARALADSIQADRIDEQADRLRRKADSIRRASGANPPPSPGPALPPP